MGATIAGDPAEVTDLASDLAAYASVLGQAGDGLRTIDTTDGWEGKAADGFRSAFRGEPQRWRDASDAFAAAAGALDHYAVTLGWARDTAARVPDDAPDAREQLDRIRDQLASVAAQAARTIDAAAASAPDAPGLGQQVEDAATTVGGWLADVGAGLGNAMASFSNAAVNHPGTTAAAVGGGLLVAGSALGELGGGAVDATGVGIPLGLGIGAASTAGILTGVGIAGTAVTSLAIDAAGPDRVQVFHADSDQPAEDATPEPPFPPPTRITGRTKHGQERIEGSRGDGGVTDAAVEDAVANPVKPPEFRADQYGGAYKYTGRNGVVVLNENGEVVMARPANDAGRRIPR